ncbi:MAG: ATP-binding cassette domain-containing protein [Lentisphaeria bacterium]|nr:ATP-binding cassette domain-containing protein [Lentisphaeria bacterium]
MTKDLWELQDVVVRGVRGDRLRISRLRIQPGVTAVLGASGAGKTTLLNLLAQFETPDEGSIRWLAGDKSGRLPVFWSPQTHGLWPHLTASGHLEAVGVSDPGTLLMHFGLDHRADTSVSTLSQGECARLSVARALGSRAEVVLLDEPLACIGQVDALRCWSFIRQFAAENDMSLVFSTHSPAIAHAEAARAICLREGELVHEGELSSLHDNPPDQETGESLGPLNWFEPTAAERWLTTTTDTPIVLRPEHLALEAAASVGHRVLESRRCGGDQVESLLSHESDGEERRLVHQGCCALPRDSRVILKMLALLILGILTCSCQRRDVLPVHRATCIAMPPFGQTIPAPRGIEVTPAGEVLVIDTEGRILVFGADRKLRRQWAMPESDVGRPENLTVLRNGNVAVPDTHYHRVILFSADGREILRFGCEGAGPGQFMYPVALAEDADGNLYVTEYGGNDRVQVFTAGGRFLRQFGGFGTGGGEFQRPSGIVWRQGRIYVADATNHRIQQFDDDGRFLSVLSVDGIPLHVRFPYDLALDGEGALWVPEWGGGSIARIDLDGGGISRYGSVGRGTGNLLTPWGVAAGMDGRVYVADTGNRRIVEVVVRK